MSNKLTAAQVKLLERLMLGPASRYSTGYNLQTARWLVKRGYAHPQGFNGGNYSSIIITSAGRKALEAAR